MAEPPSKHGPDQDRTRDVRVSWDTIGHEAGGSGRSEEKQKGNEKQGYWEVKKLVLDFFFINNLLIQKMNIIDGKWQKKNKEIV